MPHYQGNINGHVLVQALISNVKGFYSDTKVIALLMFSSDLHFHSPFRSDGTKANDGETRGAQDSLGVEENDC